MGKTEISLQKQNTNEYLISPFRQITKIGDPFVMYDTASHKYYMYCTGGLFRCWSSETMKTWKEEGDSYQKTVKSFGTQKYWAPEVFEYRGTYYMVYSAADDTGIMSIGLASSERPEGPYTDVSDTPLFSPGYSVIDADLLFDEDGKIYLYYAKDNPGNIVNGKRTSQIFGIELLPDLSGTVGEPVLLATPEAEWETCSGSVVWNEGPCVFRCNGIYYLLYSANYYASVSYCIGYATSDTPLGPYTKYKNNPILKGDGVFTSGTGHCSVTHSPDGTELYIVYHSHTDVTNTSNPVADRTPCVDRLIVREDGTLAVNGPSVARQPLPSGALDLYKQYDGVSILSSYSPLTGSPENLKDGYVPCRSMAEDCIYSFTADENGCITVCYDAPVSLNSLWIYGVRYPELSPGSVYAVINGVYMTGELSFSQDIPQSPVIITGSSLPGGTAVSEIKLYFSACSASGSSAAICEILTVVNG